MDFRDEARTAVIIASGPSAADAEFERLAGWPVVVVNDCWRLFPSASILYACDSQWWDRYAADTQNFAGARWTQDKPTAERYGLNWIAGEPGAGFSRKRGTIFHNWNSGAQAMQLAHQQGARRLILIGFDCTPLDGRVHFFGDHPSGLINESPWQMFMQGFEQMARDAADLGVEIINTSQRSRLTCFRKAPLAEVL